MMKLILILFLFISCTKLPTFETVKKNNPSSFREIYDEEGELIHETRVNFKTNRRAWVELKELPKEFVSELVLFEDQRFFSHPGVDPLALLSSVSEWPRRGASTITMQLVGLIHGRQGRRGVTQKIYQIWDAIKLEQSWSKEQILEAYLNLTSFKGELQGLNAITLGLFKKWPHGLSREERVVIMAMIPSPNQDQSKLMKRACRYLQRTHKAADCASLQQVIAESQFDSPLIELQKQSAPHVANRFLGQSTFKIKTSLNKNFQEKSIGLLRSQLQTLRQQNVSDGAILVVERKTAQIKVYIGSSGNLSQSPHVDHVRSFRQAGSTLKPLIYAQAIAGKLITMSTLLKDEPFSVTREGLSYRPENYQKSFTYKDIPAKVALGSSLNIPAIRVIDLLTPTRFYDLLQELEMSQLAPEEFYGHSMALGAVDITLWDLVRAYRTLAEGGEFKELSLQNASSPSKKITAFTPQVSFIIGQILSEKENRHLTFGIHSSLSTDSWSAVKTGTSKDMRDNWCIGITDKYVIGVWIGNSSGSPMWNVTGISGAAPLFSELVSMLHEKNPSRAPIEPAGLVQVNNDHYLIGTEPKSKQTQTTISKIRKITFPQDGNQFAFDPEIPFRNQRIHFQSSMKNPIWKLNGKIVPQEDVKKGFLPEKKGRYTLELVDGKETPDSLIFYVKSGK